MTLHSVDNLVVAVENSKLEGLGASIPQTPSQPEPQASEPEIIDSPEADDLTPSEDEKPSISDEKPLKTDAKADSELKTEEVDDYGNEVPKPRVYTEEEVQRMIRDRLSRGNHQPQQPPAPPQATTPTEGQEDWEVQLRSLVKETVTGLGQEERQKAAMQREHATQAEFEVKFNMGMNKFKDFTDVVAGKPITDSMMLAARSMKDPAAFIYAASKNHATELNRIAALPDPYHQATEIGRLEEKMRKSVRSSQAPAPAKATPSDMNLNAPVKKSIDNLIQDHARRKFRR